MNLRKSSFREKIIEVNDLEEHFGDWVFRPGMLFGASEKWWDPGEVRARPHEGLDLCFYRDKKGNEHLLTKDTMVPVIYRGEILKIEDDFIGKSVYVGHDDYMGDRNRLYTIYGHIKPAEDLKRGVILEEGDIIGAIAEPAREKTNIAAHLHISVALISKSLHSENLTWKVMADSGVVFLQDPLEIIS
jgi:murein DD-endopeptidase MepM/ murein hydrolase activator NlpD